VGEALAILKRIEEVAAYQRELEAKKKARESK
jgi:hypothetical protein